VEVFDGMGHVAKGRVAPPTTPAPSAGQPSRRAKRDTLTLELGIIQHIQPIRPSVTVCSATPKGQRVDEMVEGLSQAGAAGWRPMRTAHGVVDPRESKLDRLARISRESAKQAGRAWLMRIEGEVGFAEALGVFPLVVVADASGQSVLDEDVRTRLRGVERVGLLVGPEGGFTHEELDQARAAGALVVGLGPLTMRIETAAVIGAAMLIEAGR
jgi:16S rRNA (uracil1498-N3)-methyltransferase